MPISTFKRSLAVIAAVVSLGTMGSIAPAGAAETDPLQRQIHEVLERTDGGVQISPYEIAWNGGEVIEAFPLPGEAQAPPSSAAAQKLQAKISGLPAGTRETDPAMQSAVEVSADDPLAIEPSPAEEAEPGVSIAAADTCPTVTFGNDWYCFYQYKSFGGRRLQWSAAYSEEVMFSKYDFVNRTSSWSNKGGKTIYVLGRTVSGSDASCRYYLWTEDDHERAASVPHDNQADCFYTS